MERRNASLCSSESGNFRAKGNVRSEKSLWITGFEFHFLNPVFAGKVDDGSSVIGGRGARHSFLPLEKYKKQIQHNVNLFFNDCMSEYSFLRSLFMELNKLRQFVMICESQIILCWLSILAHECAVCTEDWNCITASHVRVGVFKKHTTEYNPKVWDILRMGCFVFFEIIA